MIDNDGYRLNVGIVLLNADSQVFWGRRKGESSWQFPQGGLYENEDVETAMFRELNEELGLLSEHVEIIGRTEDWLYYDVPATYNRSNNKNYRGQKQIWYLLQFIGKDYNINVKYHKEQEFDAWRWINYWDSIDLVIDFKQDVYKKALNELSKFISNLTFTEDN
ncbi:MAG: RNA pyrophosphohydrolase [Neisseriaceae bacterium]|jgi:putative (di)nucleoside polyphosphate hydrolase